MNTTKIILGVVTSVSFTALTLAIASYFIKDYGSGDFISFDTTELRIIIGLLYGGVTGMIAGAIISGFQLNMFTGILFGLFYNLFLGVVLLFLTGGGWGDAITNMYYASVIIGTINGAVVSLINSSQNFLK